MNKEMVKQAIAILKPIPSKNFIIGVFTGGEKNEKHCSMGWINLNVETRDATYSKFGEILTSYSKEFCGYNIAPINDIQTPKYPQKTPKARVLRLLNDMLKSKER